MMSAIYDLGLWRFASICVGVVKNYFYDSLLPKAEKDGDKLVIRYTHGSFNYKLLYKKAIKKKGPSVGSVTDGSGTDVTEDVKQFMGPFEDFHGSEVTPGDLGHDKLVFYVLDPNRRESDTLVFLRDDVIKLDCEERITRVRRRYEFKVAFDDEDEVKAYELWLERLGVHIHYFERAELGESWPRTYHTTVLATSRAFSDIQSSKWYRGVWEPKEIGRFE